MSIDGGSVNPLLTNTRSEENSENTNTRGPVEAGPRTRFNSANVPGFRTKWCELGQVMQLGRRSLYPVFGRPARTRIDDVGRPGGLAVSAPQTSQTSQTDARPGTTRPRNGNGHLHASTAQTQSNIDRSSQAGPRHSTAEVLGPD